MRIRYKVLILCCILALLGLSSAKMLPKETDSTTTVKTIATLPVDTLHQIELVEDHSVLPEPNENADLSQFTDIQLLVFKNENRLEIWADSSSEHPTLLKICPITIPEGFPSGVFDFEFHYNSLAVNFPDEFYRKKLKADRMSAKVFLQKYGCEGLNLDIQDTDTEFIKRVLSNPLNQKVAIFPNDSRIDQSLEPCLRCPSWYQEVLANLELQLQHFTKPKVLYPIKHKHLEKNRIQS